LERKFDCPYLGRLANDIFARLWRSDSGYLIRAEEHFSLRIDPKDPDYRALGEMLDLLHTTDRESDAWLMLDQFLGLEDLSIRRIAERIPLTIPDLSESFASIEYYRQFRKCSPLADYAGILYKLKLDPHREVPEILFHLLAPSYFMIAAAFQDSGNESDSEKEFGAVMTAYRLISSTFAAFGGVLLSPKVPDDMATQSELLAGAAIIGLDIPLMEVSRLIGFLSGASGRAVPENYQSSLVDATSSIHEVWLTEFFKAVGRDWQIKAWCD
jgi:hypothetical protein